MLSAVPSLRSSVPAGVLSQGTPGACAPGTAALELSVPTSLLHPHPPAFAASHLLGTARWGLGDQPPCSRSLVGRPGTQRARSALGGWRRCQGDTGWACVTLRLGAQGGHRSGSGLLVSGRWAPASGHPPRSLAPWLFYSTWRDPRPSALAGGASPGLMPPRANDKATPSALSCPHRTAHATQAPGAH